MKRIPDIVSVTDLRQDAAAFIERACTREEPIVITQRSHAVAVLLGVSGYERMVCEREILGLRAKGETEIREAKTPRGAWNVGPRVSRTPVSRSAHRRIPDLLSQGIGCDVDCRRLACSRGVARLAAYARVLLVPRIGR